MANNFPPDFLWGVGTAAYQAEGGITNNDWEIFTTSPTIVARVHDLGSRASPPETFNMVPAGEAVHHSDLRMVTQDLDRCKELGLNCYRFSVEWSRIEPARGELHPEVLDDYYVQVVRECRARGLEPVVTLQHLTLPLWVCHPPTANQQLPGLIGVQVARETEDFRKSLRGWENPETIDVFINFVRIVVQRLTQEGVRHWLPLNEPVGSVIAVGYIAGVWPPGFTGDGNRAKTAYFNVIKAHVRAYDAIKAINPNALISVAHNMSFCKIYPGPGAIFGDHAAARNQVDYFYHYHFLDAITSGRVDVNIKHREGERQYETPLNFFGISEADWRPKLDYIGLNYYRATYARHDDMVALFADFSGGIPDKNYKDVPNLVNALGWEIYPEGLYQVLKKLYETYSLPILITENGIAEKMDNIRSQYILAHLQQVVRARADGINVLGYIHWSIVDNFEWAYQYDSIARFGLYFVDRSIRDSNGFFPRVITKGAQAFQKVVLSGDLDQAVAEYGTISADGIHLIPPESAQAGWRWCNRCQGLFFSPDLSTQATSRCPAGGGYHILDWFGSNYSLQYDLPDTVVQQSEWRRCAKCQGLHYGLGVANSRCPSGDTHTTEGSLNYNLRHEVVETIGRQKDWRWCIKCQGLHFEPNIAASVCPAGGSHESRVGDSPSANYSLPFKPDVAPPF